MEFIGYAAAVFMGLSLGLIGGGGSILTVPILVYLFRLDPVESTAYSLFVVGLTSFVGSFSHFKNGNVHLKTALIFGIPSILSVFLMRKLILPLIPDPIFTANSFHLSKSLAILILFALLMLLASLSMIRKPKIEQTIEYRETQNYYLLFFQGLLVGGITGSIGAGGGFLIIPALVLFGGLSMRMAIGTSLVIITLNSLIGFTSDLGSNVSFDYNFLIIFSAFAMLGIIAGSFLSKFIANERLKPIFGWFVMGMGVYILTKELLF